MNRRLEIVTGLGVCFTTLMMAMAVFRTAMRYQDGQVVPGSVVISVLVNGVSVALSFAGAFILLSGKKSK